MNYILLAAGLLTAGMTPALAMSPVALTTADSGRDVQITSGSTVTLSLPTQGGAPYAWTITSEIEPQLSLTDQQTVAVTPGMIGGPANLVFTFLAGQPGTITLTAGYYPFKGRRRRREDRVDRRDDHALSDASTAIGRIGQSMANSLLRMALAGGIAMAAAGPFIEAHACACCADEGERRVGSMPYDETYRSEVERFVFGPAVNVFGAGYERDEGASGPVLSDSYTMTAAWQGDAVVFSLKAPDGAAGTLAFKRPEKISVFEVDPRQTVEGGMGPTLYKEWKLTGAAEATGSLIAAAGKGQSLTLILQGRGNRCSSAEDFTAWTLVAEGPVANFTLFGTVRPPN